ncbi:hypothetical protein K2F43_20625 [Clostridium estertheticum]|uniref:hypothetical protein n=1 Tax=Clostridium estertheticum TaxID=238834 RepID=UPI001C6E417A|nr:hypothetical protein [Clostridium estertheticum]MBW9173595.1 hypothetical protein [Clostridium estertheticum]WLC75228.1 hypothetical protein KTC99_21345 [Clostridium estertheticum]
MKKQTKILIGIVTIVIIAIGGYLTYPKYDLNKRVQASAKMGKEKGITAISTDKDIVEKLLKNDTTLEYAYISYGVSNITLHLKFKAGIKEQDKSMKMSEYMEKVREQHKGKAIDGSIIPNK